MPTNIIVIRGKLFCQRWKWTVREGWTDTDGTESDVLTTSDGSLILDSIVWIIFNKLNELCSRLCPLAVLIVSIDDAITTRHISTHFISLQIFFITVFDIVRTFHRFPEEQFIDPDEINQANFMEWYPCVQFSAAWLSLRGMLVRFVLDWVPFYLVCTYSFLSRNLQIVHGGLPQNLVKGWNHGPKENKLDFGIDLDKGAEPELFFSYTFSYISPISQKIMSMDLEENNLAYLKDWY